MYITNIHYKKKLYISQNMALVAKDEVMRVLRGYNPWWSSGQVPPGSAPEIRRTSFWETQKLLIDQSLQRAIVLSGPRRVGKTTILYQLISDLLHEGVNPASILYLTLEHPILKLMSLDELLETYESDVAPAQGKKYVFFDELQYHDDPVAWLKLMVDRYRGWKFVATGSASITFKKKDRESGAGRTVSVEVPTLSFYEYLQLRQADGEAGLLPDIEEKIIPTQVGSLPAPRRVSLLSKLKKLRREFGTYLLQGGFPETARTKNTYFAQRMLREDIVDKVLKRDMAAFYKIRKLTAMERLFAYVCLNNGGIVNMETIGEQLKIDRLTVNAFLDAFEGAHLAREVRLFGESGKKILKGRAKWYVVDASMRNAVLLRGEEVLEDATEMGSAVVESAVINHLVSYHYGIFPKIGYWKDSKGREVDLIVDVPTQRNVAVEVKYREKVSLANDEGIYRYLAMNKDAIGIVVCKDAEDFEMRTVELGGEKVSVTIIPAYAFLYLLGKYEYERMVSA